MVVRDSTVTYIVYMDTPIDAQFVDAPICLTCTPIHSHAHHSMSNAHIPLLAPRQSPLLLSHVLVLSNTITTMSSQLMELKHEVSDE